MRANVLKTGITVVALSCLLATVVWSSRTSVGSAAGQAREKTVETIPPIFNEPVKLVGVKVGQKGVKFGEKFAGPHDWLKGASFRLKNVSGKSIVFIELDVNFPETRASGPEMSFRINLGRVPNINHQSAPLSVLPGGELDVDIDDKRYGGLVKFVQERHSISDIGKARVEVGFVVFDDGMAWGAGSFYRQAPENPKRWLPIND
jgi:hypothetical protein